LAAAGRRFSGGRRILEGKRTMRRIAQSAIAAALAGVVAAGTAMAQPYPSRPVTLIVPFAAGGATDVEARQLAEFMSKSLGQPIVVENALGAGGNIGARLVARAKPDGYTLLFGTTSTFAINPATYKSLGYDPLTSFAPVARVLDAPLLLVVHPSVPVKSVKDLINFAKSNPGKLNYGSSGVGTPMHVATEMFRTQTGVNLVHVPYRGGSQSVQDVVAGQLHVLFENPMTLMPLVQDGKLRALAMTGDTRNPLAPEVPTMQESGVEFVVTMIKGVVAPAGTPPEIVQRLNAAINEGLRSGRMREVVARSGGELRPDTPENFRRFIATELKKWAKVAEVAGIRVD
jgi:tripartite-type tricarboxylate transporter receptor subunit TctC